MGHGSAAKSVAIAREAHLRRIGRVGAGAPPALRWLPKLGHALFGALAGYGYRPLRVVAAMAIVWFGCSALYSLAADHGAIAPTDPLVFDNPRYERCRAAAPAEQVAAGPAARNWTRCPELAPEYPAFRPLTYSLDLLLPLVDLQQEHRGAALNEASSTEVQTLASHTWRQAARWLSSLEVVFGWLASLMLVATLAGWFQRDRTR
jgi:hypothetical protein